MTNERVLIAFLVCPLVVPVAAVLAWTIHFSQLPSLRAVIVALIEYGGVAYLGAAIFGIPSFIWLRTSRWRSWWMVAVCGATIGIVIAAVLFALVPELTLKDLVIGYLSYGVVGAISGLVFWLISFGFRLTWP